MLPFFIAIVGVFAIAAASLWFTIKNLLYVCQPNEVLVFSGRKKQHGNLATYYRIVKGGRAIRVPILEVVDRIDLTNMIIEVSVRNAYSKGGIPLNVQGVANIKIPGQMPLLYNALERFLGRSREDIMRVARETLEGNLRGVLAGLTPEEVSRDKEAFATRLLEEAGHDLEKIGLVLDTLNIQNVSDEVGYLDAIGRMRGARIRRDAQVAEAEARGDAAEVKWENSMRSELANLETKIEIARKENDKRVRDARTQREALIAEQRATVQAALAEAEAEIQLQDARIEQVALKLQADLIRPAEATRDEAIASAKANAMTIIEEGKASAQVLMELSRAYRGQGAAGRDVLLMQKLVPVLGQLSGTIGNLRVDRLTVIGKNGSTPNGNGKEGSLAGQIVSLGEQVRAATGIDVAGVLKEHFGDGTAMVDGPTGPRAGDTAQMQRPHASFASSQDPRNIPPAGRGPATRQ